MTRPFKRKLTSVLIGSLIVIPVILGGYFYVDKMLSRPLEIHDLKIDTTAALKLNILKQISKKNGITEWELQAASATLLKDEDKATLVDVSVIFYTKDHKKVHLASRRGTLQTKTHDITFSDQVTVTHETFVLKTDKLHYTKKDHIIYSDTHVTLEKEDSVIEADSMTTRLNDNTTVLKGHVRGNFSETFHIQ